MIEKKLSRLIDNIEVLEIHGDVDVVITGITNDSRKVAKGDIFVAVRGARQDGHHHVDQAVNKGAAAILAEEFAAGECPVPVVLTSDTRRALSVVSDVFYDHPSTKICLIGVTGTNGKTTTTLLLEAILKEAGYKVGVVGTLAYRWDGKEKPATMTTPESVDLQSLFHEMLQDGVTHVVMEVSSHALALGRVDSCRFRAGVFTNLSQDHLDFHQTMEDYFAAKALLFKDVLPAGGEDFVAVVNVDDPFGMRLAGTIGTGLWTYGISAPHARVGAYDVQLNGRGISASFTTPEGELEITSPLLGRLNLYNSLCAATTALALGLPPRTVQAGLRGVSQVDGRLQRVPAPQDCGYVVVVDYAHTPDALQKALECLREMTRGRLWVVFGCGGDRDRKKRPLMGQIAAELADRVILTSDNPRSEAPDRILADIESGIAAERISLLNPRSGFSSTGGGYMVEIDRRKAIETALSLAMPDDVVLIAGKGHETYQLVGDRVLPFDDRRVVMDHFNFLKCKAS